MGRWRRDGACCLPLTAGLAGGGKVRVPFGVRCLPSQARPCLDRSYPLGLRRSSHVRVVPSLLRSTYHHPSTSRQQQPPTSPPPHTHPSVLPTNTHIIYRVILSLSSLDFSCIAHTRPFYFLFLILFLSAVHLSSMLPQLLPSDLATEGLAHH
jgi:hypothetical protein